MSKKIVLSAFNIHTGGGFTLLNEILNNAKAKTFIKLLLDQRIIYKIKKKKFKNSVFVKRKIIDRFIKFLFNTSFIKKNNTLFCFNGLPPFLKNKCKSIVYVQTFYFTEEAKGYQFPFWIRLRIMIEKIWFWKFYNNIDELWVQTNHMKDKLESSIKYRKLKKKKIKIVPFVSTFVNKNLAKIKSIYKTKKKLKKLKLFYPADLSAHKNHQNLLKAYIKLKKQIKINIYLTLPKNDFEKLCSSKDFSKKDLKGVINLGIIENKKVFEMFKKCMLIFPSFNESFGLPLIEASSLGTPIVASNRSFVREICRNAYLFNPNSVSSMVNAILKIYKNPKKTFCEFEKKNIYTGKSFLNFLSAA